MVIASFRSRAGGLYPAPGRANRRLLKSAFPCAAIDSTCGRPRGAREMEGVRRVARAILKYFVALLVLAIILQIYFAGEGIFGARAEDDTIEDAKALDLHRGIGFILTNPVALLLLIVAVLAWLPDKRLRIISIVL